MQLTVTEFYCPEPACGHFSRPKEYDGEVCCPYCGCPSERPEGFETCERPARWVSVAAYDVQRAYGGPEEGGWYYDEGTPIRGTVREFEACDFPQVAVYREMLRRRFNHVRVSVEERSKSFPETRPYYC